MRRVFAVGFISLLLTIFLSAYVVPVQAANPTLTNLQKTNAAANTGVCTKSGIATMESLTANTFILTISVFQTSSSGTIPTIVSISDTYALSWTYVYSWAQPQASVSSGSASNIGADVEIWYAVNTGTTPGTTDTITITLSAAGNSNSNGCLINIDQISTIMYPVSGSGRSATVESPVASSSSTGSISAVLGTYTVPSGSFLYGYSSFDLGSQAASISISSAPVVGGIAFTSTATTLYGTFDGATGGPYCNGTVGNGDCSGGGASFMQYFSATAATGTYGNTWYFGSVTASVVWSGSLGSVLFNPTGSSTTGGGAQTQTIGECPTKNTATFAMVNNTIYWYTGNALGSEVINTIKTAVSSVTGSNPHTLRLLIYATGTAGTPSATDPATKRFEQAFAISGGTTNNVITVQTSISLGSLNSGQFWAIGVVGDSHINLNQSSTSGLYTNTGSASTSSQPSSFTSLGTSVGTKLYLCATGSYQSAQTTMTVTTTAAASVTVTTTSTAVTIDQNTAISTGVGFSLLLIILLAPAMAIGGAMALYTHNGAMAAIGFVAGLTIGAGLGSYSGLVPAGWIFITVVLDILLIVSMLKFGGGGGGG